MSQTGYEGVGEVDAEDMLALLDASNVHPVGYDEVGFSCLFLENHPFGDRNPSAHINRDTLLWRCKGCGKSGNVIGLVGPVLRLTPLSALRWLRDNFGDVYREPRGGSVMAEMQLTLKRWGDASTRRTRVLPEEAQTIGPAGIFRIDWRSDHPAVEYMVGQRGFDPDLLADVGFGWDSWTERVVIPVRDETGALVGFNARSISPGHAYRYRVLGDLPEQPLRYGVGYGFDLYEPDRVLFGLDRALRSRRLSLGGREPDLLVAVEGELNRVALEQADEPECCSIGNAGASSHQARILRANASTIVLFLDSDEAGLGATWGWRDDDGRWQTGLVEKLAPYARVLVVPEHEGDPASMEPEHARELIDAAQPWMQIAVA